MANTADISAAAADPPAVAVWLVSTATGAIALVAAVLTYAIGVAVTTAATIAFITDLSQRARYGAADGVFGTIYDVGDALGQLPQDCWSRASATRACSRPWARSRWSSRSCST